MSTTTQEDTMTTTKLTGIASGAAADWHDANRRGDAPAAAQAWKQLEELIAQPVWDEAKGKHRWTMPANIDELARRAYEAREAADRGRKLADPVGIVEIAGRLGVTRGQLDVMRHRGQMPEPEWTVGGRPAWDWPTIQAWWAARS